jgi:stearoyl-CoA desaturase (Delta-9 desaturase)
MQTKERTPRISGVTVMTPRQLRGNRIAFVLATVVPFAGLGLGIWTLWGRGLSVADAAIAGTLYCVTGLGVTAGFHRLFAHKAFEAPVPVRAALAAAGSLSIEMAVIDWVATHRRHHAYSDRPGDPHSPHLVAASGWRGALKGLWYAHIGWMLGPERSSRERWAPDLLRDPVLTKIDALFPVFVVASFVAPALLGLAVTRSLSGALSAFLWGGLVRIFLLHHVTFSINSICHFFGRRPYDTTEHSANVWPLALLSFGESWHNNHHAFPSSAFLGLRLRQLDPGRWLIRTLAAFRLATKLKIPSGEQIGSVQRAAA